MADIGDEVLFNAVHFDEFLAASASVFARIRRKAGHFPKTGFDRLGNNKRKSWHYILFRPFGTESNKAAQLVLRPAEPRSPPAAKLPASAAFRLKRDGQPLRRAKPRRLIRSAVLQAA